MPLTPDQKKFTLNGVLINQYLLSDHGAEKLKKRIKTKGITVHNFESIVTKFNTTCGETYVRETLNGRMKDIRVHYYVDNAGAWEILNEDSINISCGDGIKNINNGNNSTIAVGIIGNNEKTLKNSVKLIAFLLDTFNLTSENVYPHKHWKEVNCPKYILPIWDSFIQEIDSELSKLRKGKESLEQFYQEEIDVEQVIAPLCTVPIILGYYYSLNSWHKFEMKDNWYELGDGTYPISAIALSCNLKNFRYRVHLINGGWLNYITEIDLKNKYTGFAGIKNLNFDFIQIQSDDDKFEIEYRVNKGQHICTNQQIGGAPRKPVTKIQIKIKEKRQGENI